MNPWLLVLIIILALLALIIYSFCKTYHKAFRRAKPLPPYELKCKNRLYAYQRALIRNYNWYISMPKKTITVSASDNMKFKASLLKNPNNDPLLPTVILFCHGWHGSGEVDISYFGSCLYDLGYDMFVIDHEGHGESDGRCIEFGVHARKNIPLWVNAVNKVYNHKCKIILFGISMGGNEVLLNADQEMENVKAIIADAGFTSAYEQMKYSIDVKAKLSWLFMPAITTTALLVDHLNLKKYSTINTLKSSKYPVLFIHGDMDNIVPIEMTYRNYENCSSEKELYVIKNAGHVLSYLVDKEKYIETVKKFINKYVN